MVWNKQTVYDEKNEPIASADLRLRARPLSYGNCTGTAYYIALCSDVGMSGETMAILLPRISEPDAYMAIEANSPFWCRPFWGERLCELPAHVQELIMQHGERYTALLPVCADHAKAYLRGGADGMEIVLSTNKAGLCTLSEQLAFVLMEGRSATEALQAAAGVAAELLGNGLKLRSARACPEIFEYLGWCSWDAFQIRVNHKGLVEKAKELKEKKVPIRYAIIDDMWADVPALNEIPPETQFREMVGMMHGSRMRAFAGDPKRFPEGMQAAIADLKAEGIEQVGIWFPTTGYWKGLTADGEAARELGDCVAMSSDDRITVVPEPEKAIRYFDTLCKKIKGWGADLVKIDNQGFHQNFKNTHTFGESAKSIQNAIDRVTERYFGGALINCMGMPSECLFHRTDSAVCRCSDDFKPESREWFAGNILQSAYNGLLQGQYHINDWDMWWTDDDQALKNSLCRAISGGPIYVSDKLGRTRPEVLAPLCLKDGRILRPDRSATPTEDCILHDPTKTEAVFKLQNCFGENGVLAVLNINARNAPCTGTVSVRDCGLPAGCYAYYEHFSKRGGILASGERLEVSLASNDSCLLYTFAPLSNGLAVLGRADLYMGIGAVKREGGAVTLTEAGQLAVVSEKTITPKMPDGKPLPYEKRGLLYLIDVQEQNCCRFY